MPGVSLINRDELNHQQICVIDKYHKISNISCTTSPNFNVSRLVVQVSLPNPMKPGVKSRMKM